MLGESVGCRCAHGLAASGSTGTHAGPLAPYSSRTSKAPFACDSNQMLTMHRHSLSLILLLSACAGTSGESQPAAQPPRWDEITKPMGPGRTAAIGVSDRALHLIDDQERDLAPPIPDVAVIVKVGPYLRYVNRSEVHPDFRGVHLLDSDFQPVTNLSNLTESREGNWNARLVALRDDGAVLVFATDSPEPTVVPGCWSAIRHVPGRPTADPMLILDRRGEELSDLLVMDSKGARIATTDVVATSIASIDQDKLPAEVPRYLFTAGNCWLILVERQAGDRVVWVPWLRDEFYFKFQDAPSREAAIAQVESWFVEKATGVRRAVAAEARRIAELLEAAVANTTRSLDVAQQHADAYRAAVAAGNLELAGQQAVAVRTWIGSVNVPEGHAMSSILEARRRTLLSIPIDWSARRPNATLDSIADWLAVAQTAGGNDAFWQRVEQLVMTSTEPPSNQTWRAFSAHATQHLSPVAQARLRSWQGGREAVLARAAYREAVRQQDWSDAFSKSASLGLEDWGEVLLQAPFHVATPDLFAVALERVPAGPLKERLAIRREQSLAWQEQMAKSLDRSAAGTYARPGATMMDSINDLNQRMYEGNLRRYGLPRNF